jgi:hypothetical protein
MLKNNGQTKRVCPSTIIVQTRFGDLEDGSTFDR